MSNLKLFDAKMLYQVTDIKTDKLNVSFKLQTKDYQSANLFRQTLMSSIPTIAIDNIHIYNNTSFNFDEYLAHRLGLIPLICKEEAEVETTELELNVHAINTVCNVTTRDLKSNTSIVPVDDDILICKLHKGQSLHIKAYVKYGTGDDNAKWSPVTTVTFKRTEVEGNYYFQMDTHGMIEPNDLIQKAVGILV